MTTLCRQVAGKYYRCDFHIPEGLKPDLRSARLQQVVRDTKIAEYRYQKVLL
jgi:hypothetical protein